MDLRRLPRPVLAALRKHQLLVKPEGGGQEAWRQANIKLHKKGESGQPLGPGPLLDPEVIQRFMEADLTPNKDWMDWMLFQAGGGNAGKKQSAAFFKDLKDKWIARYEHGWENPATKQKIPKLSKEGALARWMEDEANFLRLTSVGDQDMVTDRNCFGFFRHWPGNKGIYERVATLVHKLLKLRRKVKAVNAYAGAEKQISFDPKDYGSVEELAAAVKRVDDFFGTRFARKDRRLDQDKMLYDDEILRVMVPLTYAAAVHYGWPKWEFADPDKFEQALVNKDSGWKSLTRQGRVLVYLQFKYVVPGWVSFDEKQFERHDLTNLAMSLSAEELRDFDTHGTRVFDEENRHRLTLDEVREMILAEPQRQYDPEQEEYPRLRSGSVYGNQEEAEKVVKHFDAALETIRQWGKKFDFSSIVQDPMQVPERYPARSVVDSLLDPVRTGLLVTA